MIFSDQIIVHSTRLIKRNTADIFLYIKPGVGRTHLLNVEPIGETFKRFFLPTSGLIVLSCAADIFHVFKGRKCMSEMATRRLTVF